MTKEQIIQYLNDLNVVIGYYNLNKNTKKILFKNVELLQQINEHTSFLIGSDIDIIVRLKCLLNDITEQGKCLTCGRLTRFDRRMWSFRRYCPLSRGNRCASRQVVEQRKQTMLSKYNVDNSQHDDTFKYKKQQTVRQRYGHQNVLASKYGKSKSATTKQRRYGDQYYNNREKARITISERYSNQRKD